MRDELLTVLLSMLLSLMMKRKNVRRRELSPE
jgi:hypothetical protein